VIGIVEDIDARKRAESLLTAKARLDALDAEIGKALTQADTLQASLKLCAEAMVRHLDAAFARIWTMNRGGDTLELQASAGMYTHLNGAHARIPVGAFKIGRIAAECKPHLTNDVAHDERVSDKAWALANGMVGFAGYPLLIGERVVGVIGMFAKQAVPDETLDALGSISDSIAIGIERKRSEADLVAALERERSAKVELETSARALLHSNENLQHFVNAASHDLRSPLRTISLMSALLSKRYGAQLDGKGDELVKAITNGATRMDSLLSDLLSFCTTSHSEKVAEPVSMKEALGEALENLRSAIAEGDAVVTSGDLPRVMIHKTHLLQLFQNLIGNAIKYRSEARPQVNISATYRNSEWVVKVRDNGVGFDQKYADEVFGAFKRLHGGEYPGSGIGLATCKRIVDGYGGAIWAESKVGCGSSFFFTLPAELAVSDMPISRAG
jgi:signal transduction histidine kinase